MKLRTLVSYLFYFAQTGNCEISMSSIGPRTNIAIVIRSIPINSRSIPVFIISITVMRPVPKMMALGGVATGIRNAKELASVAGTISIKGFLPIDVPRAASIGNTICEVAVFEVSSVRPATTALIDAMVIVGCRSFNP